MDIIECGNKTKKFRLKITKADYLELQKAVLNVVSNNPEIRNSYIGKGLSDKRFRWDMVHASGFNVCSLYHYLNDNHIDTALRHITKHIY